VYRESVMTTVILSVVVLYVVILVLGIRAGVETYVENRSVAKWYSHVTSAFDRSGIQTKFARKGENRQSADFEGRV